MTDRAVQFLEKRLEDGQWHAGADVIREMETLGITKSAWQAAKKKLLIETRKNGMSDGWLWRLPEEQAF